MYHFALAMLHNAKITHDLESFLIGCLVSQPSIRLFGCDDLGTLEFIWCI